ncbi:GmrSD restriction endonuclease domain-containing protein [Microbacterium halophytorum]|uniref:GmrSD restriction endonuclease domain-containing protein n=1 Tax=Microbacterium halophytorum TaxID=2067568 RepID=UPI001E51E124|nr:DUF1524 domain-containing protein [Microbacterium halophytorum]
MTKTPAVDRPFVPGAWWWFAIVPLLVMPIAIYGFAGALMGIVTVGLLASITALATKRGGVFRLPSRAWGWSVLVASIALTVPAGALLPDPPAAPIAAEREASPTPDPMPTAESPSPEPEPTPSAEQTPSEEPTAEPDAPADGTGSSGTDDADPGTALALLGTLAVKGTAPETGYDRVGDFGESWLDVDGNGCDTRNDILQRDLANEVLDGACVVLSGDFVDPYTGASIDFVRGIDTSRLVQIDHVVALKDAWRTGAQQLSQEARIALANDPVNLLASDGSTNASKGASNAASWLPPNRAFRCEYVARQISAKAKYGLWVVPPERDAMERVLSSCPEQPAFASADDGPRVDPTPQAPPAEQPAPQEPAPPREPAAPEPPAADVSYENCTAVRDAGAAPIRTGDPGYSRQLDRDGDGIACE